MLRAPRAPAAGRLAAGIVALILPGVAALADARASMRPPDPYPSAAVAYVLAVDGSLVAAQDPDGRRAPASLTKLLTALTLLRWHWDPGALVPVSAAAAREPSPRAGLRPGERLRASDALTAMLVHSANDACRALVEHAPGGSRRVAARMNELAARLGLTDSRFVNPCGFDAPGQYSTARDLLRLARAAAANPVIAQTVTQETAVIHTAGGRRLALSSTNVLLGRLDGVIGLKTGHTSRAGDCLIALARRSHHRVWLVLLGAHRRWWTAQGMLSRAFEALDADDSLAPGT